MKNEIEDIKNLQKYQIVASMAQQFNKKVDRENAEMVKRLQSMVQKQNDVINDLEKRLLTMFDILSMKIEQIKN